MGIPLVGIAQGSHWEPCAIPVQRKVRPLRIACDRYIAAYSDIYFI